MKILLVEDDAIVIQSCRRVLEAEGMEIHVATTVDEGEAKLAADRFDLMLTDIKMPGRDGFEIIDYATKTCPNMLIVMMTGYMTPETIEKGRRAGADNYVAKPFTPEELIHAVRSIRDPRARPPYQNGGGFEK